MMLFGFSPESNTLAYLSDPRGVLVGGLPGPRGYPVDSWESASAGTAVQFYSQGVPVGGPFPLPSAAWNSISGKPTVIAAGADAPTARGVLNVQADRTLALQRGASVWSNLVDDTHIHAGSVTAPLDRPVSVSVPSVVTPGAANLLSGLLPLVGATVGTLGSGGVLPTGLAQNTLSAVKVLNAVDADSLDISFTAQAGQVFAGSIYFNGYTPPATGQYLLSFTVECVSTTSAGMRVRASTYNPSTSTAGIRRTVYQAEEGIPRRVVARIEITDTAQRFSIAVDDIGTTDQTARFILSDFMLIAEPTSLPVYGGLLSVPPYGQESTAASDITINIPVAGDHMIWVKTVRRGWIATRATLSAGSNTLSSLWPGASFTAEEILAVPASVWVTGDMDVIKPPDWRAVRYHNGASAALSYPRSYADLSQMLGEPVDVKTSQTLDKPYASAAGADRSTLHRFEVHSGDQDITDVAISNTNNRAEVGHSINLPFGTDVWISDWVKIDGIVETGLFAVLLQIRQVENATGDTSSHSPQFSFDALPNNKVRITYRTDGGVAVLSGTGTPAGITTVTSTQMDYTPGRWHRWVVKINISDTGGGTVSWWWDGAQIVNAAGPVGFDRDAGPVVRHGIYRAAQTVPLVVTHQHLEVATSSLSSRVTAPLPI